MRVITLDINNKVVSVKNVKDDYELKDNEIATENGRFGQIMQPDGTFITPEPEPIAPQESLEEKIERLEQQFQKDNLVKLEVLATIFEELMMIGSA